MTEFIKQPESQMQPVKATLENDGLRFWCAVGSEWSSALVSAGSWTAAFLYTCSLWRFSKRKKDNIKRLTDTFLSFNKTGTPKIPKL